MSTSNTLTHSMTSTTAHQSGSHGNEMEYESMFNPFNSDITSSFGSVANPSFNSTQTSSFHRQTSSSTLTSSNLGLERLVLSESPTAAFTLPGSQSTGSPPFGGFDATMANFPTGIPIESMLDVTSIGETPYFDTTNVVTEQTARLMRHYIDNLASWMDLSDARTHFSTVVPKRALTSVSSNTYDFINSSQSY